MAIYEYRCRGCGEEFTHRQNIADRGESRPSCPRCGGPDVQQLFRSVNVQTSRKS
jgi:putative FmdB family regulatory protein